MQENNFEDKMRQKMADLVMNPSAELWPKVAVQIQKKEKDRRVFLWIFLGALLIGGGFFLAHDPTKNNLTQTILSEKKARSNKTIVLADTNIGIKNSTVDATNKYGHQTGDYVTTATIKKTAVKSNEIVFQSLSRIKSNKLFDRQNDNAHRQTNAKESKINYHTSATTKVTIGNVDEENIGYTNDQFSNADKYNRIMYQPDLIQVKKTKQASIKMPLFFLEPKYLAVTYPGNEKNKSGKQDKNDNTTFKKWQIGIAISAGQSFINHGLSGGGGQFYIDANSVGTVSNPSQSANLQSISLKPGIGLKAGLVLTKQLSPKVKFVTGVNYLYYSAKFAISDLPDSAGGSVVGSDKNGYRNGFHFIELPIGLQWRLTKEKSLPVYLQGGINISRLLSTSALQFTSNSYFKNDRLFNKNQAAVALKILFGIGRRWLVGPEANYNFSKIADSGFYQDKHYSYFGIHFQSNLFAK